VRARAALGTLCAWTALASPSEAQVARPFAEERQILDRHLAQLADALPDTSAAGRDEALLRQLAASSGFRDVAVAAPVIAERDSIGRSRFGLAATATFTDVDRFARALLASRRLIDVEGMTLRYQADLLHVEFQLATFHYSADTNGSAPAARLRDRASAPNADEAARFARDQKKILDKTLVLDRLRRSARSPRLLIAEIGAAMRDRPVAMSFASYAAASPGPGDAARGETFVLRGVINGVGGSLALEERLLGGFLSVRDHVVVRSGACFRFETTGYVARAGLFAELTVPVEDPFRDAAFSCVPDRDAAAASPGAVVRRNGTGRLWLRARDIDLADVAAALEALTREPLVVAASLRGRVGVDLTNVTLDEALAALPWTVENFGAVRLLRVAAPAPAAPARDPQDAPAPGSSPQDPGRADSAGPPRATWLGKRAPGALVLSDLAQSDPSLAAYGPASLGTLSVFAHDAPAADLYRAAIAALGLEERTEDARRLLRSAGSAGGETLVPVTAAGEDQRTHRAREIAVSEIVLAGTGRNAEGMLAFVYSPLGRLVTLRLGDELADGRVGAIESGALIVDSPEGPLRISLPADPPPPRPSR
jgi:hypothetical protein